MFRSSGEPQLGTFAAGSDAASVFSRIPAVVPTILETTWIPMDAGIHHTETRVQVIVGLLRTSLQLGVLGAGVDTEVGGFLSYCDLLGSNCSVFILTYQMFRYKCCLLCFSAELRDVRRQILSFMDNQSRAVVHHHASSTLLRHSHSSGMFLS